MSDTTAPSRASEHLALLDLDDGRHLANTSDRAVRRLVYSTWAYYPDMLREGEVVVTARPHFELTDFPAQSGGLCSNDPICAEWD